MYAAPPNVYVSDVPVTEEPSAPGDVPNMTLASLAEDASVDAHDTHIWLSGFWPKLMKRWPMPQLAVAASAAVATACILAR